MSELRFYLDESVSVAVARQLELSGLDVVSAASLGKLGDSDPSHLQKAVEMGRVLCTYDQDFLRLAAEGASHAGIAYGDQSRVKIGTWVKFLRRLHQTKTAEEARGEVFFVSWEG